jgi:CRISPR-associated endonuclease/helicase Cas3
VFYIKEFYAKSNPKETIQKHTDNLLNNYEIIKKIYPKLNVNLDLLKLACIYHDLGKINEKFQNKIVYGKKDYNEIAHNLLSLAFIDTRKLKNELGYSLKDIKLLAHAVAYHHDRGEYDIDLYNEEVKLLQENVKEFYYDKFEVTRIKTIPLKYFNNDRIYEDEKEFYEYVMLKGLLNRLDYAASGYIDVEIKNNFLENSMENLMKKWKEKNKDARWNELQEFMWRNKENNIICVAQTGMGKTEAGLRWIGDNKGFFTLPLKTAINEIYKRITTEIVENKNNVGLLHSDTLSKYIESDKKGEEQYNIEEIMTYYNQTRQLSLPLTVCTLDQTFDFVYRYRDFEPKLATLSYSKVVIDEIQMYSPNLLAYLILGLKHITKVGGQFSILTATFPKFIEKLLKEHGIDFIKSKTPFITDTIRHNVKVIDEQLNADEIIEKYDDNKILVVCNTVKKAQEVYGKLIKKDSLNGVSINLLHSKFIKKDRSEKEKSIMELGKIDNKESGIWIGTQVVEASLDIDFDMLFTELSDINGLLQRLGRCYRKREFIGGGYNCYVYTGGDKPCSGIRNSERSIIDFEIFTLSKNILLDRNVKGKISEKEKLELIDEIYTNEKLKDTKYLKKVKGTIDYLEAINAYELSKSDVKKIFRDIANVIVIPKQVFEKEKDYILKLEKEINRNINKDENYKNKKIEKYKFIDKLRDYTVSISWGEASRFISEYEFVSIGKYEKIFILDCDYSQEKGIVFLEKSKDLKTNSNIDPFV